MELVFLDTNTIQQRDSALAEQWRTQYAELMQRQFGTKPKDSHQRIGRCLEDPRNKIALLLKEDNSVMAGAMILHRPKYKNGFHLPDDLPAETTVGYVTRVAGKPKSFPYFPGLELQKRVLQTLKEGNLGFDILIGHAVPGNALVLAEAERGLGVSTAIRSDIQLETPGGPATFIAYGKNDSIPLVPSTYEPFKLSAEQFLGMAAGSFAQNKRNRRERNAGDSLEL